MTGKFQVSYGFGFDRRGPYIFLFDVSSITAADILKICDKITGKLTRADCVKNRSALGFYITQNGRGLGCNF